MPIATDDNPAIDEIAFLANSANRVAVLERLEGGAHSRHVLAEEAGVSRVTVGRILDDFAERRWITQRGQVAEITPLGSWVRESFEALCEVMAAERSLRPVAPWFPPEGFGFPIEQLHDAEITLVSRADAAAPISKLVREFDDGGRVRAFSFAITGQFLEACWRAVTAGSATWEWVFTPAVFEVLVSNPRMARWSRELLASGRATYHRYDGDIPYVVIISGSRVNIRLADDGGAATALVQSDDGVVRSWAEETFEGFRRSATPLTAESFTG